MGRTEDLSEQKIITSWTHVLEKGEYPPYRNKTKEVRKLMIEWGGTGRKAITWTSEQQLIGMAPLSEEKKSNQKDGLMAPLSMKQENGNIDAQNKNTKHTKQVQKVKRRKVWTKLKNGLFGWKFVKLTPYGDLCERMTMSSTLKTLDANENSEFKWVPGKLSPSLLTNTYGLEQRKINFKRKLEGEYYKGAIKRLNLDSGLKQESNPDLGFAKGSR